MPANGRWDLIRRLKFKRMLVPYCAQENNNISKTGAASYLRQLAD